MRTRSITPGFYKDEDLAECSIPARLLYPALWMMADREGRLAERPRRIKMEIFPCDNVDCEELIGELERHGMILRYQVEGEKYIYIPSFKKYQHPHPHEAQSTLPAPPSDITGGATKGKGTSGNVITCQDITLNVAEGNDITRRASECPSEPSEPSEPSGEKTKTSPPTPPEGIGGGDPPSPDEEAEDRNDGDMPGGKVEDDEGASPAHAPPPCPHEEIVALYHEILPELPRVREWGKASRSHLNARWRERSDRQNLGWWRDYFESIRNMDWLMGRVPSKDRRDPFRADLLWLSGAQNMAKVLSGRYVRGQPPRASPDFSEPKPQTYEEAKALEALKKQRESPGPRTYEEAKALEHGAIIDAEFRQIGGDSS